MRCPMLRELPPPPQGKTGWPWTEETPQSPDTTPDSSSWPKISIVTPSLNQGQFIEETIRSVLLQGYPKLEHVIIDSGSVDESVKIIKQLYELAVFWLDAHHCSLNTAGKGSRAPVLEEINAIGLSAYDNFILIDDARLFLAPPPDPHLLDEYPDIYTLLEQLNRHKKHYILIYDDVIICVPESARKIISGFCKKEITYNYKVFLYGKPATLQADYSMRFVFQLKVAVRKAHDFFKQKKSARQRWNKFQDDFHAFAALNKKNYRFPYRQVQDLFPSLQLKQYALIPDSHEAGDILYGASETLTDSQNYGCGCFWFTKKDEK